MQSQSKQNRSISFINTVRILFAEKQFIFGFALFMLLFSAYLSSPFIMFDSHEALKDKDMHCKGLVTKKIQTPIRETVVYVVEYNYEVDSCLYNGKCYSSTGQEVGEEISIAYASAYPEESSIDEQISFVSFGILPLFVVIGTVSYIFMHLALRKSIQNLTLIRNGVLTSAKVLNATQKGVLLTGKVEFSLLCRYYNASGDEFVEKFWTTATPNKKFDKYIDVLYNPTNAKEARIFDSFPLYIKKIIKP